MLPNEANTSLNQAETPSYRLYWLAAPVTTHSSHTEYWPLSNIQDKHKQAMHELHRLGTANIGTYSYRNWQNMFRMSNTHPSANSKISDAFWHMKAVALKEQTNALRY